MKEIYDKKETSRGRNAIYKIKFSLSWINAKLDTVEEKIRKLENTETESTKNKVHREKDWGNNEVLGSAGNIKYKPV